MSSAGRKIASAAVVNRKSTPFFGWLRQKLLAVDREVSLNQPSSISVKDGKCVYHEHNRFPNTQSARSPDFPLIPGGPHHKLAENYYYVRDGRRDVDPPKLIYKHDAKIGMTGEEAIKRYSEIAVNAAAPGRKVNFGPRKNFGIQAPTPGFGYEWKRSIENEEMTQNADIDLKIFQNFDAYKK